MAPGYYGLAKNLIDVGNFQEAISAASEAIAGASKGIELTGNENDLLPDLLIMRARAYCAQQKFAQALKDLEIVTAYKDCRASAFQLLAYTYVGLGRMDEAEAAVQKGFSWRISLQEDTD